MAHLSPRSPQNPRRDSVPSNRRRQHHSCDQCRKSKRACDALFPTKWRDASKPDDNRMDSGNFDAPQPCSNCTHRSKQCTFEWLISMRQTVIRRRKSQVPHAQHEQLQTDRRDSAKSISSSVDCTPATQPGSTFAWLSPTNGRDKEQPSSVSHLLALQTSKNDDSSEESSWLSSSLLLDTGGVANVTQRDKVASTIQCDTRGNNDEDVEGRSDKSARKRMRQYNVGHSNRQQSAPLTSHSHSAQDTSRDGSRVSHDSGTTFKFLPVAGANLSWSANQSILTESLVRVYRDSMENALSCWLTERTCPYVGKQLPFGLCTPGPTEGEEWGPVWTNRICTRVCRLDRAAATIRGRPLTLKEERAASRALHSTIMAFSTQWAQSKARCTTYFPSFVGEEACSSASKSINPEFNTEHRTSLEVNDSGPTSTLSLDFEQSMQETFWHQARQALQDSADVDSFRVVFAHIIFSLTQKPNVEQKPGHLHSNTPPTQYNSSSIGGITAGMDELELIVDSDGPPIFLEMAMRQLFSYRCKLERMERQKITGLRNANSSPHHRTEVLSYEDRQTFDLLFWLGVMFDTLSSAMHKRPLVVSDEDSDILSDASSDSAYSSAPETTYRMECMRKSESKLWGQFFLQQKQFESGDGVIRWPCPIERAAIALSDAAPVKVLLFRKVTYLQTLLSRQVKDERLEDAICDALSVHKHWNDIYGSFIMDCIANHDDLPPRIQSWYVVLAGHWHLAGLLLADLIESIDECGLGLESKQNLRLVSCLVPSLRTQNAYAISDLGRCSSPRSDSTFSKGREFHFAVNEGALLTEPWTAVLIRSFGKAGYLLLDWTTFDDNERGAKARCEDCIQALWYLGRKSNMAMKVAEALSNAMKAKVFRPATENTAGSLMGPAPDSLQPDCDFEWQESMAEFMPIPPLGVEMIGMRFDEFI